MIGGIAATEEIFPAFKCSTGAHLAGSFSREISAEPMVEYFRPLLGWLREQNRGRRCGW